MRMDPGCAMGWGTMNAGPWLTARCLANHAGLAAVGLLLAACGPEAKSPTSAPTAEVRGEPIRGEAIVPKAPATPEAPVSSGKVVASTSPAESTAAPVAAVERAKGAVTGAGTSVQATAAAAAAVPASAPAPAVATDATSKPVAVAVATAKPQGTPANPLSVGFDKLASFAYVLPEGPVDTNAVTQAVAGKQIPETIKDLNNQTVSIKGFMLPLKVEKGLVTELLIMRDQSMCCYGSVPKINEWVSVKMVGDGVKPVMDQAVTLFGKLKVGEMYENGYLVGIYALDGERMAGPLDL